MALHVAVDADDVLVSFWPKVIETFNREFGEDVRLDEPGSWDDNKIKTSRHFGEGRRYQSWWDWWRDRHWLWATCDAVPGAIGGLAQLQADGHYVEILTSKPEWARREMTSWLAKWHPSFDRLTLVPMGEPKHAHSDADVLVDDKPANVFDWTGTGRHAVLFERPWLKPPLQGPRELHTASSWDRVLSVIDVLAEAAVREAV